jgi:kinetochore protein Spc24
LDIEGERLASEVARLSNTAGELEDEGVEGAQEGTSGEDATVLKLKLYRSLGVDVEVDGETGAYTKAVVRNVARGDVHVVNIEKKFSRQFYTNWFWRTM